jgi:hypothetical protein
LEQGTNAEFEACRVSGSGSGAGNSVGRFLAARRQHDDRHRGRGGVLPQRLADEPAVHPRQHQIEDDQIGRGRARMGQDVPTGRDMIHRVTRPLQIVANEVRDVRAVLDHEHACHGGILP